MADNRVTIHLVPIDDWDKVQFSRTLTLTKDTPTTSIGRSSKRKGPDRMPANDNAWFESRVVSREHAELSISQEQKALYIRDLCSSHGTWLNNLQLITEEKTLLVDGDTLRFGVDINHGDGVFPALSVRCEIDWSTEPVEALRASTPRLNPTIISHADNPPRPTSSRNTFCVPEDDSDMEEIQAANTSFDDSNSAACESSAQPTHKLTDIINVDDNKDISPKPHSHVDLQRPFSVWESEMEEERSEDQESELEYVASEYSHEDSELASSKSTSSGINDSADVTEDTVFSEMPEKPSSVPAEEDSEKGKNNEAGCIDPSVLAQDSLSGERYMSRFANISKAEKAPQPISPSKNSFSTRLPPPSNHWDVIYGTDNLGGAGCLYQYPYQSRYDSATSPYPRYRDGPFSWDYQPMQLPITPSPVISGSPSKDPFPRMSTLQKPISEARKDNTDTADEKGASLTSVTLGSKRKASEMESLDTMQDTQKYEPSSESQPETSPRSQLVSAISSALSDAEEDVKSAPPAKRVKPSPSPAKSLTGYTATAVISAMLGGLGTIVLLAALPAEYFQ